MWRHAVWALWLSALVACGSRTSLDADGDLEDINGGAPNLAPFGGDGPSSGTGAAFSGSGQGGSRAPGGRAGGSGFPSGGTQAGGGAPPGRGGAGFAGSGIGGFAGGGPPGVCHTPEGTFLPGQAWTSFDSCAECTCLAGGSVTCFGRPDICGCIAPNGQELLDGEVWRDPAACTDCYCMGGIMTCTSTPDCFACRAPDGSTLYPREGWATDCEECWCEAGELFCEEFCEEPVCDPTPCGPTGCCLRNGECGHPLPNGSGLCVRVQASSNYQALEYCPRSYVGTSQQAGCCLPNGLCGVALGPILSGGPVEAIGCAEPIDIPVPQGPDCCAACITYSCTPAELQMCSSTPGCLDAIRCLFELGCGEEYRNTGTITEECQETCIGPHSGLPPQMCSLACDNVCPPPP